MLNDWLFTISCCLVNVFYGTVKLLHTTARNVKEIRVKFRCFPKGRQKSVQVLLLYYNNAVICGDRAPECRRIKNDNKLMRRSPKRHWQPLAEGQ